MSAQGVELLIALPRAASRSGAHRSFVLSATVDVSMFSVRSSLQQYFNAVAPGISSYFSTPPAESCAPSHQTNKC